MASLRATAKGTHCRTGGRDQTPKGRRMNEKDKAKMKRYNITLQRKDEYASARIEEQEDGEFVKYEDHLAEIQHLQERVAEIEGKWISVRLTNATKSVEIRRLREEVRSLTSIASKEPVSESAF